MGQYDDIDPAALRKHLIRLAHLILRLEEEGSLLREAPRLQKVLGDLRQHLFAYEVRSTSRLEDDEDDEHDPDGGSEPQASDAMIDESQRIVREAIERFDELRRELDGSPADEDEEQES